MAEREPSFRTEEFTIDVRGTPHRGQRVVMVDDTEVRQELRYEHLRKIDPDVYTASESEFMRAVASEILWRLVAQWKAEKTARAAAAAPAPPAR